MSKMLFQRLDSSTHNPALRYGVVGLGLLREGYFADLDLINPAGRTEASQALSRYRCGWTPFNGHQLALEMNNHLTNRSLSRETLAQRLSSMMKS